jgi:enoyl-CoA hydratase/carnithine racemase
MPALMSGTCPEGFETEDKTVSRQIKSLSFTAPIGLKMASDLINATASTSLGDGLQMELDGLDRIFSTKDALEGLSALIENRRATYNNE